MHSLDIDSHPLGPMYYMLLSYEDSTSCFASSYSHSSEVEEDGYILALKSKGSH